MSLLYVPGYYANAMRRAESISLSHSAHSRYPETNLQNGRPHKPFMFNAAEASYIITAYINALWNGGFESWPAKPWPTSPRSSFPYSGQHNGNGFVCYPGTDGRPYSEW